MAANCDIFYALYFEITTKYVLIYRIESYKVPWPCLNYEGESREVLQAWAGLHPNAMIHIIRFAGELNVFHYCHSSEEVGGAGRRVLAAAPALRRQSVARRHSRCPVHERRDATCLRLTHSIRVCVPSIRGRSPFDWSLVHPVRIL
ncbi:hypothetical protein KGM_202737 [Danaus plexippus plexippus]|uniref:Uncharacterized protein n=1 Tax=Danaus plexippus plexippus TaxID=278856 RepID=A0A212EU34_DANPL|nr:hypothetical protein KGM_202737 [Danaus plexippus plexippus]